MAGIVEDTNTTDVQTQQVGLISTVFRCYRDNFGLFWRIMLPLIIFSLLLDTVILYGIYHNIANTSWIVSTSNGFSVTRFFQTGMGLEGTFTFSSYISIFLWHTMCPLALAVFQSHRGMNTTFWEVWRRALRRTRSILGASLLLVVCGAFILGTLLFVLLLFISLAGLVIVIALIFACIVIYFAVRWSLYNQSIIIEDLSAIQAFRRSGALIRGRWWSFFGRYLILLWGSGVLIGVLFAITLLLLSVAVPEFAPIREALLSERFFNLFLGIDAQFTFNGGEIAFGNAAATLAETPSFWTIGVILVLKTFLYAALAPVWAILTTHLYLKQTGEQSI